MTSAEAFRPGVEYMLYGAAAGCVKLGRRVLECRAEVGGSDARPRVEIVAADTASRTAFGRYPVARVRVVDVDQDGFVGHVLIDRSGHEWLRIGVAVQNSAAVPTYVFDYRPPPAEESDHNRCGGPTCRRCRAPTALGLPSRLWFDGCVRVLGSPDDLVVEQVYLRTDGGTIEIAHERDRQGNSRARIGLVEPSSLPPDVTARLDADADRVGRRSLAVRFAPGPTPGSFALLRCGRRSGFAASPLLHVGTRRRGTATRFFCRTRRPLNPDGRVRAAASSPRSRPAETPIRDDRIITEIVLLTGRADDLRRLAVELPIGVRLDRTGILDDIVQAARFGSAIGTPAWRLADRLNAKIAEISAASTPQKRPRRSRAARSPEAK